jgi:hypothetical protein
MFCRDAWRTVMMLMRGMVVRLRRRCGSRAVRRRPGQWRESMQRNGQKTHRETQSPSAPS